LITSIIILAASSASPVCYQRYRRFYQISIFIYHHPFFIDILQAILIFSPSFSNVFDIYWRTAIILASMKCGGYIERRRICTMTNSASKTIRRNIKAVQVCEPATRIESLSYGITGCGSLETGGFR
jgi:hypothetical protein